ncbi:MAG: hypothetical protein ACE5IK_06250 [Acidobacteriota bacterium]
MRRPTKLLLSVFFLVTVHSGAVAARTPPLAALAPDMTDVLVMADAPTIFEEWPQLPAARFWREPSVQKFVAPFMSSAELDGWMGQMEEATGRTSEELFAAFTGRLAAGITGIEARLAAEDDPDADTIDPGAWFLAEVGKDTDELWAEIIDPRLLVDDDDDSAEYRLTDETLDGADLHMWVGVTGDDTEELLGWAHVNDLLVVASQPDLLRRLVTAVQSDADDSPLSDTPGYRAMKSHIETADLTFYIDLDWLLAAVEANLDGGDETPNMMGVAPRAMFDALGVSALQAGYASVRFAKEPARIDFGIAYEEPRGLLKAIALHTGADDRPSLVPDDAIAVGVANFDWREFWDALHAFAEAVSPTVTAMIDTQVEQLGAAAGTDVVDALFSNLGTRMVSASFLERPDQPGQTPTLDDVHTLLALSLDDRQGVEMALSALQSLAGPGIELFDLEEYLGTQIHVSKPIPNAGTTGATTRLAYAFTDTWLLVSMNDTGPLHRALSQLADPSRSIWERPEVAAALARLQPGTAAVRYQNVAAYVNSWIGHMVQLQELAENTAGREESFIDPDARPDADLARRYFGAAVGGTYRTEQGLHMTVLFLPAGP